ncbi:MAG: 50S ribosomal protein L9 [uncultured bacterium]|nr:MAG: 50S ribosomal protein L9 [uncultured bacterium]
MKKKVIMMLCENVENLGLVGDQVTVSLGYAKNYLMPKKLVLAKGDLDYQKLLKEIKAKRAKIQKEIEELKKVTNDLSKNVVSFAVKVSHTGKLFGSVTAEDIADKIKVDKKYVVTSPLKTLGEHLVKIKMPQGIESEIKVVVVAEKDSKSDKK